jgi:type IV pilus assembly protein PilY1
LWAQTYSADEEKSYLIAIDYTIGGATANAAFLDFPKNISMIEVAASTVTPAAISLPEGRRHLVISGRDGLPQTIALNPVPPRPIRSWRQLPAPSSVLDLD